MKEQNEKLTNENYDICVSIIKKIKMRELNKPLSEHGTYELFLNFKSKNYDVEMGFGYSESNNDVKLNLRHNTSKRDLLNQLYDRFNYEFYY